MRITALPTILPAMKFSVRIPGLILYRGRPWEPDVGPEDVLPVSKAADILGYDYIRFSEHVVVNREDGGNDGRTLEPCRVIGGIRCRCNRADPIARDDRDPLSPILSTLRKRSRRSTNLSRGRLEIIAGAGTCRGSSMSSALRTSIAEPSPTSTSQR